MKFLTVLGAFLALFSGCAKPRVSGPKFELGPEVRVELGPSEFRAHPIYVDGALLEPAACAEQWVSPGEVLYLTCEKFDAKGSPGVKICGGELRWYVLDVRAKQKSGVNLPGFHPLISTPLVKPPWVAYVGVSEAGELECAVYDWPGKRILSTVNTGVQAPGTDVIGADLPAPEFSADGKSVAWHIGGKPYRISLTGP